MAEAGSRIKRWPCPTPPPEHDQRRGKAYVETAASLALSKAEGAVPRTSTLTLSKAKGRGRAAVPL
jgi:hypothetical protein